MLQTHSVQSDHVHTREQHTCLRMSFKIFHDVEKIVVDLRLIRELQLDLVEKVEGVFEFLGSLWVA
jgi:hypothetical protein